MGEFFRDLGANLSRERRLVACVVALLIVAAVMLAITAGDGGAIWREVKEWDEILGG